MWYQNYFLLKKYLFIIYAGWGPAQLPPNIIPPSNLMFKSILPTHFSYSIWTTRVKNCQNNLFPIWLNKKINKNVTLTSCVKILIICIWPLKKKEGGESRIAEEVGGGMRHHITKWGLQGPSPLDPPTSAPTSFLVDVTCLTLSLWSVGEEETPLVILMERICSCSCQHCCSVTFEGLSDSFVRICSCYYRCDRVMLHIILLFSFCPPKIDVVFKITIGSKFNGNFKSHINFADKGMMCSITPVIWWCKIPLQTSIPRASF
jgi:hypothetical protein